MSETPRESPIAGMRVPSGGKEVASGCQDERDEQDEPEVES